MSKKHSTLSKKIVRIVAFDNVASITVAGVDVALAAQYLSYEGTLGDHCYTIGAAYDQLV